MENWKTSTPLKTPHSTKKLEVERQKAPSEDRRNVPYQGSLPSDNSSDSSNSSGIQIKSHWSEALLTLIRVQSANIARMEEKSQQLQLYYDQVDNAFYQFDKGEIRQYIANTQYTMMTISNMIATTWPDIKLTIKRKVKEDFMKERRAPKDTLRIASYGSILILITFLKRWHSNLQITNNNIRDLEENIQTLLLNQYELTTTKFQFLIDNMKKLEHTKLWAQDLKTKINIGIFSLDDKATSASAKELEAYYDFQHAYYIKARNQQPIVKNKPDPDQRKFENKTKKVLDYEYDSPKTQKRPIVPRRLSFSKEKENPIKTKDQEVPARSETAPPQTKPEKLSDTIELYEWANPTFKHWDGSPTNAPEWTNKAYSTDDLQIVADLRTQAECALRIKRDNQYSFELNGLKDRLIFDIKLVKRKGMAAYMAFRSTSYTRTSREEKCVEMRFPLSCWTEIASSLL